MKAASPTLSTRQDNPLNAASFLGIYPHDIGARGPAAQVRVSVSD